MSVQLEMSPLQLKELLYKKVLIESAVDLTEVESYWAPTFDFDGVKMVTDLAVGVAKDQQDNPRHFMVEMKVAIPNEPEDGKRAPYTIDIQAQAWIEVADGIAKEKRREIVDQWRLLDSWRDPRTGPSGDRQIRSWPHAATHAALPASAY